MDAARRYHSLDALRAVMMLLGIVLHSMASYTTFPLSDAWPFRDSQTSEHFNLPLFAIHVFRMPTFFALAGFFAALLHERDGLRRFAINRAKRVLLPLLIFWFALAPMVGAGFVFAIHMGSGGPVRDIAAAAANNAAVNTMHLWFLYYLVIFYGVVIVLVRVTPAGGPSSGVCATLTTSRWVPLLWAAVTAITLLPATYPVLDGATRLFPPIHTLAGYSVFFLFGWLLFRGRERLNVLPRRAWGWLASGVVTMAAFVLLEFLPPVAGARALHVIRCLVMAICTWSLVLGIVGGSLRYLTRERPLLTYLSRAAYWVYLVHLPLVIIAAGALAPARLPAVVKFVIVLMVASGISLATYHQFVRGTAVGALLNGRRFAGAEAPRGAAAF